MILSGRKCDPEVRIGYGDTVSNTLLRYPDVHNAQCNTGYVMDDQTTKTVVASCNITTLTPALQYTTAFTYTSTKGAPTLECESKMHFTF